MKCTGIGQESLRNPRVYPESPEQAVERSSRQAGKPAIPTAVGVYFPRNYTYYSVAPI